MEIITSQFTYEQLVEVGVGQGLNSHVFRAFDRQHGGEIAVKEIPKTSFPDPTQYFREAAAMRNADCPNVVPIRVASAAGDRICIVMPYLRNGSLLDRIKHGPITLKESVHVGQGMLKGLGQIHMGGLIHFDVKPSNILFSEIGEALVADLGQARHAGMHGVTPVPPMYFSARPPETILGRVGTSAVDIYQAGVTIYRAVNGEPNYQEQLAAMNDDTELEAAILNGTFPHRDGYLPHVPRWMRLAINKAMSVDPAQRFHSPSLFMEALGKPIRLDWEVTLRGGGEIDWTVNRRKKPSLLVRLRGAGTNWNVEVYTTQNGGMQRAKDRKVTWRSHLKRKDALKYLRALFHSLERS
jgi:eukaryotic-like serine/threonine-protein kinase